MVHVLEGDVHVVLRRHVVGEIVIEDEAQQAVQTVQLTEQDTLWTQVVHLLL